MTPQYNTERVFRARGLAQGAEIRQGCEAVGIRQDTNVGAVGDAFPIVVPFGDGWFRVMAWNRRHETADDVPVGSPDNRAVPSGVRLCGTEVPILVVLTNPVFRSRCVLTGRREGDLDALGERGGRGWLAQGLEHCRPGAPEQRAEGGPRGGIRGPGRFGHVHKASTVGSSGRYPIIGPVANQDGMSSSPRPHSGIS
ncbi:hypothetical protein ACFZAU_37100 [Streptomyces sp. NPDC008238]